jgi:hypothetical protein
MSTLCISRVSPHLKCLYWFTASDFMNLDIPVCVLPNVPHSTVRTTTVHAFYWILSCLTLAVFVLSHSSNISSLSVCTQCEMVWASESAAAERPRLGHVAHSSVGFSPSCGLLLAHIDLQLKSPTATATEACPGHVCQLTNLILLPVWS